jgi:hypothetical protein
MATFSEDIVGGRGMGGGVFGGDSSGVIMGLLLGRLGLFGNNENGNGNGCVTNETINQQTLGDIKAAIPYNEAQVQLALAQAMSSMTLQNTNNTQYLSQGQTAQLLATSQGVNALGRDIANVDTNVDRQSTAIQQAIYADGERTRGLITTNRIADLEQQLTVAQLRESEQRGINREIVNTNTITIGMNQQQAQQQQQMQALQWQLNQLCGAFGQVARATNSQVVVGSTGVGANQTANPTNVVA